MDWHSVQNGEYLVVANEGEAYHYNGKNYGSPNGSVTLINYTSANDARALQIELSDYSDVKGMLHKSIHELLNELLVEAIAMKKLMFQYKIIRLQIPNLSS